MFRRFAVWAICLNVFVTLSAQAKKQSIEFRLPYRHQLDTSTCWLQCGAYVLDQQLSQRLGGVTTVSSDFILLQDLRARAMAKFLSYKTPWDPGAGMTRALAISLEYGLYTKDAWRPLLPILENEEAITKTLDAVLKKAKQEAISQKQFVVRMDESLKPWSGELPPKEYYLNGRRVNAQLLASEIIEGDAMAYEFRTLPYNGAKFGLVSEAAWSHILSREGKWKPITDVLGKQLYFMPSAEAAIAKAVEIFAAGRPLYFTFIYYDDDGQPTFDEVDGAYRATNLPRNSYASSHFLFVSALEYDDHEPNKVLGFWVRDSVSSEQQEHFVSIDFVHKLGKTFHTIGLDCESYLKGSHRIIVPTNEK